MMKKYLELNDLKVYKESFDLSNSVWNVVLKWSYFEKDTVGKQLVKSVDSISANIAEGYGRYYKKEKITFFRYSLGSLRESYDWLEKARIRKLLSEDEYEKISSIIKVLPKEINNLIKYTNENLSN